MILDNSSEFLHACTVYGMATRVMGMFLIPGGPKKTGTVDTVDFSGLYSNQQLSLFTLLDRTSFPHYNNTKIIKFG